MPTILSHPAPPLAIALGLGPEVIPPRLLAAGVIGAILPDLDVLAFRLGISYSDVLGHRGFSHSLLFAFAIALIVAGGYRWFRAPFGVVFAYLFVCVASHGLLDTLTNGGWGIALLWPFSEQRWFAPFQPIEVAPLGLGRFFSMRGVEVLVSELLWVWAPSLLLGLGWAARRRGWRRPAVETVD